MSMTFQMTATLTPEGKDLLQNLVQEMAELPVEFFPDMEPGQIYPHPTKPNWIAARDAESYNAVTAAWGLPSAVPIGQSCILPEFMLDMNSYKVSR